MNCCIHEQRPAKGACVYCGKLFCEDCLVEVDGKYYCKDHIKVLLENQNGSPASPPPDYDPYYNSAQPNIYINNTNTNSVPPPYMGAYHPKSKLIALILCFFFGVAGFHRFYVGKIGTGILWLFTGGFFGIGWIVDFITIVIGSFRDANGYYLN